MTLIKRIERARTCWIVAGAVTLTHCGGVSTVPGAVRVSRSIVASPTPTASSIETSTGNYSLRGTLVQRDTYAFPYPVPLQPTYRETNVRQSITKLATLPSTMPPAIPRTATVFETVETDDQPLESTSQLSDVYTGTAVDGSSQKTVVYGSRIVSGGTTLPDTLDTTYVEPQVLEEAGAGEGTTWINDPAATIREDSGAAQATRIYANDGSYIEQQLIAFGQSGTITQNADGSGSYLSSLSGAWGFFYADQPSSLVFSSPRVQADGTGNIEVSVVPLGPNADFRAQNVATVSPWYPQPVKLYSQSSTVHLNVALDPACPGPSAKAQAVTTTTSTVDTVIGYTDVSTHTVFENSDGPLCIVFHDVFSAFYDYTGSENGGLSNGYLSTLTAVTFHSTPAHMMTIDEVLAPKAATGPTARRRNVPATVTMPAAVAVAAVSHFDAMARRLHATRHSDLTKRADNR